MSDIGLAIDEADAQAIADRREGDRHHFSACCLAGHRLPERAAQSNKKPLFGNKRQRGAFRFGIWSVPARR